MFADIGGGGSGGRSFLLRWSPRKASDKCDVPKHVLRLLAPNSCVLSAAGVHLVHVLGHLLHNLG